MTKPITLFLCGDVMTGRGVDQILPHPCPPDLAEPSGRSALDYVALAEQAHGPIPRPVAFEYIWGMALDELAQIKPDARIVNFESAVTTSDETWPGKGILYRMHPANVACLTTARIDCCVLANNHVLDWGYTGLRQTLAALHGSGIKTAGAGNNAEEAAAPGVIELPDYQRVLVYGFCDTSSGVPRDWAAGGRRPGVNVLQRSLSLRTADEIADQIGHFKRRGDIVVASIHWGGNWGFAIPAEQRAFAQRLIDSGQVDLIHGHSSHNLKGIEVYRDKLILYSTGDFLDDFEGTDGHAQYRADLALMYFPTVDSDTGQLLSLTMTPTQVRRMRVEPVADEDRQWLVTMLNREGQRLGTQAKRDDAGRLTLTWSKGFSSGRKASGANGGSTKTRPPSRPGVRSARPRPASR
jgi:poly-gamma-glutamate synthesis protein (capsule biosynthesis protein)